MTAHRTQAPGMVQPKALFHSAVTEALVPCLLLRGPLQQTYRHCIVTVSLL